MASTEKTKATDPTADKPEENNPNAAEDDKLLNANTETGETGTDVVAKIDEDKSHLPIDRGWAWVVLAACFLEIAIYGGINRSFGVLFLQFQNHFNASAAQTSIMNLIQNIFISVTSLLVMTIGLQKFNWRTSILIGGGFLSSGYLITAFATQLWMFYIAFGVFTGIGHSFMFPPIFAVLGAYFEKHRGLANSIFASGSSVGALVFAPLLVMLFEYYAYSGAMMMLSGLILHSFVLGMLLRPMEFYEKRKPSRKTVNMAVAGKDINLDERDVKEISYKIKSKSNVDVSDFGMNRVDKQQKSPSLLSDSEKALNGQEHIPAIIRTRALSESDHDRLVKESTDVKNESNVTDSSSKNGKMLEVLSKSQSSLYTSADGISGSFVNIKTTDNTKQHLPSNKHDLTNNDSSSDSGCCNSIKTTAMFVWTTLFDKNILKKPVFLIFLPMAFCFMIGIALLQVFIPTHASDIGLTNTQIANLIAMQAIIDLVSKITMAIAADRGWLKRSTILAVVAFVLGTACHLIRFVTDFYTTMVFQIISGLFCGQYISMYAVFLMDVIGADLFKKSLGFVSVVHGAAVAVGFPIGGLLRDVTGRYIATFHLLGAFGYTAGVLVLVLTYMRNRSALNK